MVDYRKERIDNWVSDFCTSDAMRAFPAPVQEVAQQVLTLLLSDASARSGVEPDAVEEAELKAALLGPVARLALAQPVREKIPALCGAFLSDLEAQGRLGGGRLLGSYVRALRDAYLDASSGKAKPIVRPGSRINRNDPCPCGSGRKYKKCCMRE